MVFQEVLRNPDITIEAKGLYAYLAGFSGAGDECYPSISLMCEEMGMSKTRLYKHMAVLVQFGVVEKIQTYNGNIKGKVIYKLTHTVVFSNSRFPKNGEIENQCNAISETRGFRRMRKLKITVLTITILTITIIIYVHLTMHRKSVKLQSMTFLKAYGNCTQAKREKGR